MLSRFHTMHERDRHPATARRHMPRLHIQHRAAKKKRECTEASNDGSGKYRWIQAPRLRTFNEDGSVPQRHVPHRNYALNGDGLTGINRYEASTHLSQNVDASLDRPSRTDKVNYGVHTSFTHVANSHQNIFFVL